MQLNIQITGEANDPAILTALSALANALNGTQGVTVTSAPVVELPKADAPTGKGNNRKAYESAKKEEATGITVEKVRAEATAVSRAGKKDEVKALIKKFGAANLDALKPENYEAFLTELAELNTDL